MYRSKGVWVCNQKEAVGYLASTSEIKASALTSRWESPTFHEVGQLYGEAARLWRETATAGVRRFVVYSYRTPIAWKNEGGEWIVPAEKYSVTTSRHQSVVRRAVQVAAEVA
jgi:hypothetical protein